MPEAIRSAVMGDSHVPKGAIVVCFMALSYHAERCNPIYYNGSYSIQVQKCQALDTVLLHKASGTSSLSEK
jgi:hypothetical protein